ncbi:MAG TPA: MmcQ/YjbR family DNA-binding protein [Gaiellaceae bacterium]|jgi:hypothetical protein
MVCLEDVRALALTLPRTTEHLVRGRVKFRVGGIVYASFSQDESLMGFAFPKDEREWLVSSDPERFQMPATSDLRFSWVVVRLATIGRREMGELVFDAWRMVVPKGLAAAKEIELYERLGADSPAPYRGE